MRGQLRIRRGEVADSDRPLALLAPRCDLASLAPSFAGIEAVSSLLSAIVGSVGPLMAPLFLAYGLVKGGYIGTEAIAR